MAEPLYTCCEDGMLSQVQPTDRSGLCPKCHPGKRDEQERAAFEVWSRGSGNGGDLKYYAPRDQYLNLFTNGAWEAWKARAALGVPAWCTFCGKRDHAEAQCPTVTAGVGAVQVPAEATPDMRRAIALRFAFDPQQEDLDMAAEAWRAALLASGVPMGAPTDTERLDWLLHSISGAELRRLGIVTSDGCTRELIDAAAGVSASDGKGFGAKTPIPSPMDYEGEG